ncbi:MAG: hypothetical protein SF187_16130 [Deltaproteobacteria bacterium]|nr:hypothetical protein [Deltaproteobacteria bacterium]
MNRRPLVFASSLCAGLLCASQADAKLLDVYGSTKMGYITGRGTNTLNPNASDYFDIEKGPAFGFEVGAEILFLDFMINGTRIFDQAADSRGEDGAGYFFQFLTGIDGDFAVGEGDDPSTFLRVGVNGGAALGTHRKVKAPLDNAQVSDKGFVANGVVALDYHLGKLFVVGVELMPGYHYFFPGGDSDKNQSLNGDDQSKGMHVMGMAFLQFHLDPLSWADDPDKRRPDPRPATYAEPPVPTPPKPKTQAQTVEDDDDDDDAVSPAK